MNIRINRGLVFILLVCLFSLLFSSSVGAVSYLTENSTWQQNLTGINEGATAFGDIDNDGDLDLILTGYDGSSGITKIYENNGTSFDENSTWQQNLTGIYYSSTALGDIDNDGDLDLILTGYDGSSGITKIYENNGTSFDENSTWQQNLTTTNVYRGAVAFGDIDNDGDLDLGLIGADSANENGIYINNGTSFVKDSTWLASLSKIGQNLGSGAIAFGDFNNDNKLDLIILGSYSTNFYADVYINNGTSLIEDSIWEQNLLANFGWPSLSLGDYNNDRNLDFICLGTRVGDHVYLYENNGTTFIINQTEDETLPQLFDGSITFGDIDNDGDLDFAINGKEGHSYVYNYIGIKFSRNISESATLLNLQSRSTITFIDVNNNSALDILETGSNNGNVQAKIYTNNLTNNPNEKPTPPIQFTNYTTTSGNIHLGWGNGSDNETPSNGLYYNIRVGSSSGGNQIISGVYGGGEDNGYFGNMMQRKNFTLKSTRLSENTQYYWSVQTIDTGLRTSSWSSEMDFTTQGDLTPPTITLNTINMFNSSTPHLNVSFNCTVYDNLNITDVTLWGNWSTENWHANNTNSSGINNSDYLFSVNLSMYNDGYYIWGIRACDNSSLCKVSENRTFSIDTTNPEIDLILPLNDTIWNTGGTVTFSYNVTDVHISNCSLIVDGSIKETDYSIETENTLEISTSLDNGQHKWQINCTDEVNYQNSSVINKLDVSYNPSLGGVSKIGSGRRAVTEVSEEPVKKIEIQEKHLKEIKIPEKEKPRLIRWFETVYAFIIALFMIFGYVWIIKKDFRKLRK